MSPTVRSRPAGRAVAYAAAAALLRLVAACSNRLNGDHSNPTSGETPLPPIEDESADEPGLVSVVAGTESIRLVWTPLEPGSDGMSLALFASTAAATVFSGAPVKAPLAGSSLLLSNLPSEFAVWFGLGISSDGGSSYAPIGPVLSATTGAPIYVDATASPEGADGQTPASAFPSPLQGLLTAFVRGGGNVWIAGGTYPDAALPLTAGTRVYGGFAPGFATFSPDPLVHPTILKGIAGQPVLTVQGGEPAVVLDGLVVDGAGVAKAGLDVTETRIECHRVVLRDCAGRGCRLEGPETGDPSPALFVGCSFTGHAAEGLFGQGGLSLQLFDCDVTSNQQEGLDLDDLVAPDGRTARLHARDCVFAGNGTEGIDADLAAPLFGGSQGGLFDVSLENCRFALNGAAGLLLDLDYEGVPGWTAALVVRGCVARANAGDGVHLDLDEDGTAFVHRLLATSNGGNGLRVTSESTPLLATLSSSVLLNNAGYGLHALEGQATVLVAHSVLAGNALGGLRSEVTSAAVVSSIAWRQPTPWSGGVLHHVATADDPLQPVFSNAPSGFGTVESVSAGSLALGPGDLTLLSGDVVELADDGVAHVVTNVTGSAATVDPPPASLTLLPARLADFGVGGQGSVVEQWDVLPGSAADDAGMAAPGSPPVDAGLLSAPLGGTPGFEAAPVPRLFRLDRIDPPPPTLLAPMSLMSLLFAEGTPDPSSVSAATVRVVDAAGLPLAASVSVQAGVVVVAPPATGWGPAGATLVLELHAGLAALDGTILATPLAVPLLVSP